MCGEVPTPPEPKLILPGSVLASDEFGEVLGRERQVLFHHIGERHGAGDRGGVAHEVERDVGVERLVDGVVRRHEADGVAVGRRGQHVLHADIAAGADVVLDDELLAELFRQVLAEDARDGVVGAAGGERHDEAHRPRRIIERVARADPGEQRQQQDERAQ
jgi:hypothetical protein